VSDHSHESLSKGPGRVTRTGLLLCAALVAGCFASVPAPSIPVGQVPETSTGIAILRAEEVNGSGDPDAVGRWLQPRLALR
jgi:hypothetical protein